MTNPYSPTRQATIEEARRLLAQRPIYLDTETTGLDGRAEIIEIAILDWDGNLLLQSLVKPRFPIPDDVTHIHGITNAHVREAPTWLDLWPQLQSILHGQTVGIYNADFDLRMMAQSHHFARIPWQQDGLSSFCIMQLYARFYGERRYNGFRWQSLAKAAIQCRLPLANSHRAVDDALLARAVLHYVAEQGK
ncbi:MAG: 3'-5' exonuclease [Caldilineaceae bacterium]|nr:3'-5' exonuclease [Caldilineaceae bacterium]